MVLFLLGFAIFVVPVKPLSVAVLYTIVSASGLAYRLKYFARRKWLLYFIDFCFVVSILLLCTLWSCHQWTMDHICSDDWLVAMYAAGTGPVAGATFLLQTPLTFHHAEAFMSYFIHATPMWIGYCKRWEWKVLPPMAISTVMWLGFSRVYLPWALCYVTILLLQPWMPNKFAALETIMDGFVFSEGSTCKERLRRKREGFATFTAKVVAVVLGHALLSAMGFAAAALAFQDWMTQMVWITCVQMNCIASGYYFYSRSVDPSHPSPGFLQGFVRMLCAWCIVLPTYLHSTGMIRLQGEPRNSTMI